METEEIAAVPVDAGTRGCELSRSVRTLLNGYSRPRNRGTAASSEHRHNSITVRERAAPVRDGTLPFRRHPWTREGELALPLNSSRATESRKSLGT